MGHRMTGTDDITNYLDRLLDAKGPEALAISDDPDDQLKAMLIDWPLFWEQGHGEAEWIAEPIIPKGRSVALFAPGGTGKSLLALWLSAHIATGTDPFTGTKQPPVSVLYLDYEMTADDLAERLEQMGFDETTNLNNLHYALLPSLPGLDQPEGGKAVIRLAALCDAQLVVIDTFGRAVHGDENEADTVRGWYRWTGLHLKHDQRAFMRVDHAGKDVSKGQRGTSAKNDDVDVVWQMTAKEAGAFTLTAKKRRMGWIPETVDIVMTEEQTMTFGLVNGDVYPPGTAEVARQLDDLGVDIDASGRTGRDALKAHTGKGVRVSAVLAAQKYRIVRSSTFHFNGDDPTTQSAQSVSRGSGHTHPKTGPDTPRDTHTQKNDKTLVDDPGYTSGYTGTHPSDGTGTQCVPSIGTHAVSVHPETPYSDQNLFADPPESTP